MCDATALLCHQAEGGGGSHVFNGETIPLIWAEQRHPTDPEWGGGGGGGATLKYKSVPLYCDVLHFRTCAYLHQGPTGVLICTKLG